MRISIDKPKGIVIHVSEFQSTYLPTKGILLALPYDKKAPYFNFGPDVEDSLISPESQPIE